MRSTRRNLIRAFGASSLTTLIGVQSVTAATGNEPKQLQRVPDVKQNEVDAILTHLLRGVPTKRSERIALIKERSKIDCKARQELLPDLDDLKDKKTITDSTRGLLKNVIQNLNKAFDTSIPTKYLDDMSRVSKFIPLLSTVQNYLEVCCEIRQRVKAGKDIGEELIERFYITAFLIPVELALLPSSVGYRGAFMGTRYVANYGLVRLRQVVGLRSYSIMLSAVHWALRGTIEGAIGYITTKSVELIAEFDDLDLATVTESDLDFDFLEEDRDDDSDWFDWDSEKEFNGLLNDVQDLDEFVEDDSSDDSIFDIF